jgi:hypothetical protein
MQHEVTPRNLAALIPPPLIVQRDDGLLRHWLAGRRAGTVRIPVVRAGCRRRSTARASGIASMISEDQEFRDGRTVNEQTPPAAS